MKRRWTLRDLTDPVASRAVGSPLRTGTLVLGFAILVVVLVFLNAVPFLDWQSGKTVVADFAQANNVSNLTPVRIDGVDVGQVQSISAGPNAQRSSAVKMLITTSGITLHSDATASIRWRTVLGGNMYIALDPGSPDAPVLSGAIPVRNTSNQVELDDVLRIYDGSTDQEQRNMLGGLSQTFSAPSDIDHSISALPALQTVGRGLAPYQGVDPGDLSGLVANTAHTVQKLGASTSNLETLVSGAAGTLGAIDNQRTSLGQMLQLSPGTLDSTKVTTARTDVTLAKLNPLAQALDPSALLVASTSRAAKPALKELRTVLNDAQPVLASARPTFANLHAAASTAVPLLQQLKTPLSTLNNNIFPWLSQRSSDTKLLNYESIGPFFSVLDGAAGEYDESGYRLHLSTLLGTASVIDEADLTAGAASLKAQCLSVATASTRGECGSVTELLMGMLYGGQK